MRCVKCRKEMKRVQDSENKYHYECPNCGYAIGKPEPKDSTQ